MIRRSCLKRLARQEDESKGCFHRARTDLGGKQRGVDEIHHMRKASSEESAIHASMSSGFRGVDVFASPTVKLNRLLVRGIGESNR
jgi:hypothetical protein